MQILHLLGFAIQEELSENYPFLSFYERSQQYGILKKLDELARCPTVSLPVASPDILIHFESHWQLGAHHDFILWTIKRYKELQAKQTPSCSSGAGPSGSQQTLASDEPLSSEEQLRREKEDRARLAAERRAKVMAQIKNAQKSFMKSNAEMFADSGSGAMEWEDIPTAEEEQGAVALKPNIACLGPERRSYQNSESDFKCILCFENCAISRPGPPLVSSAFVQTSRVILTTPNQHQGRCALHVSCCGHVMHYSCWQEYYSNEETKEQRRPHRNRIALNAAHNVEFHCPYCRTLSNTVLPVSEPLPAFTQAANASGQQEGYLPLDSFNEIMRTLAAELSNYNEEDLKHRTSVTSILRKSNLGGADRAQFERSVQLIHDPPKLHSHWFDVMGGFNKALGNAMTSQLQHQKELPGAATPPGIDEADSAAQLWDTCSYTLQALEIYLFANQKPLKAELPMRHQCCATNLVRACSLFSAASSMIPITDPANHGLGSAAQSMVKPQPELASKLLDTVFCQKGASVLEWDCFRLLVQFQFGVFNLMGSENGECSLGGLHFLSSNGV